MADPFGIIGVIGVAAQVIQVGVQFGLDWKDAPADVKSFKAELQALKTVLSETNTNVILNQEFKDAFEGHHSAILSQLGTDAKTDTRAMLSSCQTELESLLKDLKKRAQGHRVGWERLRGAFLAKKTRDSVENLQRQCQMLNNMAGMDALVLGSRVHREVKESRDEQRQWHDNEMKLGLEIKDGIDGLHSYQNYRQADDERISILSWLSNQSYASQQNDYINRRQEGTGQWLLDSEKYQTWLQTTHETLFCPGIPGAGKTILTSIIVEDLSKRFHDDPNTGIAYIYCNFRQHDEQKIDSLLASLLRQLTERRSSLPNIIKDLYERHKHAKSRPSSVELVKAVQYITSGYSRAFILVDALDECQVSNGCRATFLTELFRIQAVSKANILATSRFVPDVTERFDGKPWLEIEADEHDIQAYLAEHMSHLPSFVQRSPDLQQQIMRNITEAVGGM
jgi:hypothetical protein